MAKFGRTRDKKPISPKIATALAALRSRINTDWASVLEPQQFYDEPEIEI